MGLQPVRSKRRALEVGDQWCLWAAIEREFDAALHVALQDRGRSARDRGTAGLADDDRVVLHRHLAEAQRADRRRRAPGVAQVAQQAFLAAEKSFAQKVRRSAARLPAPSAG